MVSQRRTLCLAADAAGLVQAAQLLRGGALVAFPTETVYGLGADATDPRAVAGVYAAKGRPAFNPLIAHVPDLTAARREGRFSPLAEKLAEAFWPGPLTLVLPVAQTASVCDLARGGLPTIGLRLPAHATALALLQAVGRPIAAPSANRSGHVSPARAQHVLDDLSGRIDAVLDGGDVSVGVESTIVAVLDERAVLLRPGGVARAALEKLTGPLVAPQDGVIAAPGMLASHYAPRALLRLDANELRAGETGLDFGGRLPGAALDLSPRGDDVEAAANLYAHLRLLDASGARMIAVAPVPQDGLGEAINDRLRRAAAPRDAAAKGIAHELG
ncbi:MAG: threonylcarbamoyl-AMP synthase [Hyphomicrobiales bacterium]|nr:threonylcarbamoyl-AMP synthase [Hyphomicrobiales bacterium]